MTVGVNVSQTIKVPGVVRVSVGNGKILKARAIPPSEILITGIVPGLTSLRAWDGSGKETAHEVKVIDPESYQYGRTTGDREVVHVSLEFIELNRANGEKLGIQWPDSVSFSAEAIIQKGQNLSGLNSSVSLATPRGWIHFLIAEGYAKLLANPDLYVRLGEEASFHSGGELPIATAAEDYGKVYRRVEWKSFGLTVKVRPKSGDNVHLSSDVKIEISEPNPTRSVDGIPSINRRTLETKMRSEAGETVILSGLTRELSSRDQNGFPILSAIPLLGIFFRSHHDHSEQNEIFMAMTLSFSSKSAEQDQIGKNRWRLKRASYR